MKNFFKKVISSWENKLNNASFPIEEKPLEEKPLEEKPLIVLGSSSSELFDYIFGDNSLYFPAWADGWCIRKFFQKSEEHINFVKMILEGIDRNANIFLNFGNADIDFTFRFKASEPDFVNQESIDAFVREMVLGTENLIMELKSLGFDEKNIFCTFANPPILTSDDYWYGLDKFHALDIEIRGRMQEKYIDELSLYESKFNIINASDGLTDSSKNYFVLDKKFERGFEEHHQDYTKTSKIVWNVIKKENIEGMIPSRNPPLIKLYDHVHEYIDVLIKANRQRVRTCI